MSALTLDFDTEPYLPGDHIDDKYVLEERIADGGMGVIWRARNIALETPVAIKLVGRRGRNEGATARLLLEAKAAGCLRHPSVVRVFDFGMTQRQHPYIAMELLSGESLREVLDREVTLGATAAVRTLLPILGGLACAHARGIVHRDLKPENVFLARDDGGRVQPKVVDFGVAKVETTGARLTTAGSLVGSPAYMSPEQARGDADIDSRTDVWAFGVVLYETIAGHPPWEAANCPALLRAIVDDPPVSLVGRGGVDAELWAIVDRALSKDREGRCASASDLGRFLARWLWDRSVREDVSGSSLESAWIAGDTLVSDGRTPNASAISCRLQGPSLAETKVLGRRTQRLGLSALAVAATLAFLRFGPPHPVASERVSASGLREGADTALACIEPLAIASDELSALAEPSAPVQPAPRRPRAARPQDAQARPRAAPGRTPSGPIASPPGFSARAMDFGF
jgi:serine/threonine protein kinase